MISDSLPKLETSAKGRIWSFDFTICWSVALAYYIGYFMFLPTLPPHLVSIGLSNSEAGLVIGSFAITAAVTRPLIGVLCDRGLAKSVILAGLAMATVAAAGLNWARAVPFLVGLRLLQGGGMSAFTSANGMVVANVIPSSRRGEAMSYYFLPQGVGMAVAPLLGTLLLEGSGFGIVAYSAAAIMTCSVLLATRVSKAASRPAESGPPKTTLFCKSAVQPLIVGFSVYVAWGGLAAYLPIFVYDRQIGSPGTFFTIYAVVLFCSRFFAGRVSDRYGRSAGIYGGAGLMVAALLIIAFGGSMVALSIAAVLLGLGNGLVLPAFLALAVDKAPAEERGQAVSTVAMGTDTGTALGAMLLGPIVDAAGFVAMFIGAAAVVMAGLLVFFVLSKIEGDRVISNCRTCS
ncbi:MAG: MFS transporter [Chloroflexota bacterium]|nr:MAG: MFS transporter [Chloroflexota bacterium]